MKSRIYSYNQYTTLYESEYVGKNDIGVIGPLLNGDLKLRVSSTRIPESISYLMNEDGISLEYDDRKITIPKKCCDISTGTSFDSINIKTDMDWFKKPENIDPLDDLIEAYIENKFKPLGKKYTQLEGDVDLICDILGIKDKILSFNETSDGVYEFDMSNGYQIELSRADELDMFKGFRVYLSKDDIHPALTIKRNNSSITAKYRTEKCTHETEHDSFKLLMKNPIDLYLIKTSLNQKLGDEEGILVDHLMRALKYHKWTISDTASKSIKDKQQQELSEIKKIMDILKNSIEESHIEEMYADARQKFLRN